MLYKVVIEILLKSMADFLLMEQDCHKNVLSLYSRSTDYGTTYEKLNDKVGLKTVLSYLYVSPTNKRKVRKLCLNR